MEASNVVRVTSLTNQISFIQQVLKLLDEGATITAMTLTPKESEPAAPEPVPPPPAPPEEEVEAPEEGVTSEPETASTAPEDEVVSDAVPDELPSLVVPTEGLNYPPQMLQSIRAQEIELWQKAYDELERLGVTDVPRPQAQSSVGQPAVTQPTARVMSREPEKPAVQAPVRPIGRSGVPPSGRRR